MEFEMAHQRPMASAVTSKGQATIPAKIRRKMGLEPGDKVMFSIEGGRVVLDKAQPVDETWNAGQSAMLSEWNDPEQDVYND
jgi:AbrB family looped-hinge helix DNA binding protein